MHCRYLIQFRVVVSLNIPPTEHLGHLEGPQLATACSIENGQDLDNLENANGHSRSLDATAVEEILRLVKGQRINLLTVCKPSPGSIIGQLVPPWFMQSSRLTLQCPSTSSCDAALAGRGSLRSAAR
ncbi:hypothetical protein FRB95_011529 [Tulasnella sp. JGI-2019a]|nr:hypothetical protein FRB95_011529 [Tulasnella sp. JGI-2019a]